VPIYEQPQLAAVAALPNLRRARLHMYAGVGLSLRDIAGLAGSLEVRAKCFLL